MAIFKSFRSTVAPFLSRNWTSAMRLLVDPVTGAPTGIMNPNDNGADGIWTPVDVTAAQIAAPSALMLADLNATYRVNSAPYNRYRSSGAAIVNIDGESTQGPGGIDGVMIVYAPFTITDPAGISVMGTISVRNLPA